MRPAITSRGEPQDDRQVGNEAGAGRAATRRNGRGKTRAKSIRPAHRSEVDGDHAESDRDEPSVTSSGSCRVETGPCCRGARPGHEQRSRGWDAGPPRRRRPPTRASRRRSRAFPTPRGGSRRSGGDEREVEAAPRRRAGRRRGRRRRCAGVRPPEGHASTQEAVERPSIPMTMSPSEAAS